MLIVATAFTIISIATALLFWVACMVGARDDEEDDDECIGCQVYDYGEDDEK